MIHQQAFSDLRQQYRQGKLSPVDVARSALQHADRVASLTNAFALIDVDRALAAARRSEQRWRSGQAIGDLDGMPMTIKEFAAVKGWPTRRGSLTTSADPAPESTVFVARLEEAGTVLLGKTRAPEFNWKGVTDSPGYGVTRNPWNLDLTPGGSSGGCAAAVASGVVRVSFGSDAGGSVRIPAAFSGILGLKPTFGLIPVVPVPSHFSNTAHVGPLGVSSVDLIEANASRRRQFGERLDLRERRRRGTRCLRICHRRFANRAAERDPMERIRFHGARRRRLGGGSAAR